jgi:MATE family multidrug resistance protein
MKYFRKANPIANPQAHTITSTTAEIKRLLWLALPIIGTQLAQSGNAVVDTVMAGQISALDLAAVALGSSFWVPVYLFIAGVSIATTPIVAEYFGAQQLEKIRQQVHQSCWITVALSLVAMLALRNTDVILPMWISDPHLAQLTDAYLHGLSWGIPAVAIYLVLRCVCEAAQKPMAVFVISVIGLLVNIPLNSVFMKGLGPIPALGGPGCGWATSIAVWLMLLLMLSYLHFGQRFRALSLLMPIARPNGPAIAKTLRLGLPIGCSIFFEVSIFSVIALLVAKFGVQTVAGHQIALNFASLLFMIPLSIGMALTARMGFVLGEKKLTQARHVVRAGFVVNTSIALLIALCTLIGHQWIPRAYTQDAQVQQIAAQLLLWAALFQLPDALQVACNGLLRGFQDTRFAMFITLVAYWMIGLPIGFCIANGYCTSTPWQAQGYWIGLVLGLSSAAILLIFRVQQLSTRTLTGGKRIF